MPDPSENRFHPFETLVWLAAAVFLLALRIPHLSGPLDDPHSWRQCDTVGYSLAFARHGIDLLHPSVVWLGAHRTLILEFPLTEALSALLYRAFSPDPMWDRVVSLAFFIVATLYLHLLVRTVAGRRPAWFATLAYLALPLGQFYSRAAQVDFVATAGAHGLLYHGMLAFRQRSIPHVAAAAVTGTLAALIKGPYLLPVLGPLALAWLAVPSMATFGLAVLAVGVPAAAFLWWRAHSDAVNSAVPDWTFLPGFYKESNASWWYFGDWSQRRDPAAWLKLARRLLREVATPLGALAMLAACVPAPAPKVRRTVPPTALRTGARGRAGETVAPAARGVLAKRTLTSRPTVAWVAETEAPGLPRPNALAFAVAWLLALGLYLVVFFPLNVIHSYYQIPFLAPFAMLIGLGCDRAWTRLPRLGPVPTGAVVLFLVVGLAAVSGRAQGYYRVDRLRVAAGERLQTWIPPGDLIVASDPTATHSDPRLLLRTDRLGWPVGVATLTPGLLDTLSDLGARWLAVVEDTQHPELRSPAFLDSRRVHREPIVDGTETLGTLQLFRLRGGSGIAEDTRWPDRPARSGAKAESGGGEPAAVPSGSNPKTPSEENRP